MWILDPLFPLRFSKLTEIVEITQIVQLTENRPTKGLLKTRVESSFFSLKTEFRKYHSVARPLYKKSIGNIRGGGASIDVFPTKRESMLVIASLIIIFPLLYA